MRVGETSPTAPAPMGGKMLVRAFTLEVLSGPDRGARYASKGERTLVGTDRSNDFILHDRTVSRFHCEMTIAEQTVVVRDVGSRNGTRINGVIIREAQLTSDVTLVLGGTEVRFALGEQKVAVALSPHERFGKMVGRSQAIRATFALFERCAKSDATALLIGETGTGKDIAAESIHAASARRDGPFVAVDCGAIPPALLESELFGHERGAFTGATSTRVGAFEEASGGTLFLDEIGELGADLQPKLLRAIESRRIRPVGKSAVVPVDVRIIAATNRDLYAEVNSHRFRSDLYYRLAVIEIRLPALRERPEDIELLVRELIGRAGATDHPVTKQLVSRASLDELAQHVWPGNVRELRNYIERCLALDGSLPVQRTDSQAPRAAVDAKLPLKVARQRHVEDFERRYLEQLLRDHDNNVAAAARAARVDRVHLHRLLVRAKLR